MKPKADFGIRKDMKDALKREQQKTHEFILTRPKVLNPANMVEANSAQAALRSTGGPSRANIDRELTKFFHPQTGW